jgi:hypothetical protein
MKQAGGESMHAGPIGRKVKQCMRSLRPTRNQQEGEVYALRKEKKEKADEEAQAQEET